MPSGEGGDLSARLNAARAAYAEARFDDALALLHECEDWPLAYAEHAVLVKAETLLRRDNAAALAWLATTNDIIASDDAHFQRELLTARALGNVRNFNGAEERVDRAGTLVERVPGGAAKLAFQRARLKWFRREAAPDDADIALALTDADPAARAAAYSVRAWSHAALGNYRAQIADLSEALRVAAAAGYRCDVATLGTIVHSLARIAFEIADAGGMAVARAAYEGIRWTDDVRVHQFQTLRALGLDSFMRGDVARAQWLFRDASAIAPTPPFAALAHLDRAFVARIMRNEAWALDELDEAVRIARGVPWGQTFGEERIALVALATLLAPTNAAEAQRHAAVYSMLGVESVSPTPSRVSIKRSEIPKVPNAGAVRPTRSTSRSSITIRRCSSR
jgi:tetratricopeptide (TPR) repeat protein